ncbi:MAG: GPP34 family phosphoprotein [Micromonosporaceae bacterium]|nr:GPP34 family phosphoprotein [Micromonosporaceae bacterium]
MTPVPALADDFFRLAHHDSTGQPLLHPRATGLGLAAALLAELLWGRSLVIHEGLVYPHPESTRPPADALAHTVLDQITAQTQYHNVRTWLGFLSQRATADVAERLWRAGHLRPVTVRRLLRQVTVYEPTDVLTAADPWVRLTTRVTRHQPLDPPDAFLLCLSGATGLNEYLLRDASIEARRYAAHLEASAPAPLAELLAQTAAAVGDAVLSYRT